MPDPTAIQAFIQRWQDSEAAERANFPQFMVELRDLLDLPRPDPSTPDDSTYPAGMSFYSYEKTVLAHKNPINWPGFGHSYTPS